MESPSFTAEDRHYVGRVFEQVGHRFDLRLCLQGVQLTTIWYRPSGTFEDLDFKLEGLRGRREPDQVLTIDRACRVDGLLLWLKLETIPGTWIDALGQTLRWLPVFLPVFGPGMEGRPGDAICLTVSRRLSENGLNPDYYLSGKFVRRGQTTVSFEFPEQPSCADLSEFTLLSTPLR